MLLRPLVDAKMWNDAFIICLFISQAESLYLWRHRTMCAAPCLQRYISLLSEKMLVGKLYIMRPVPRVDVVLALAQVVANITLGISLANCWLLL